MAFEANSEGLIVEADSIANKWSQRRTRSTAPICSLRATMCDGLRTLPAKLRNAVSHDGRHESGVPINAEATQESASVFFVPSLLAKPSTLATGVQGMSKAYPVFAAADKLQARGGCIIASKLEAVTPSWALGMALPFFEAQADLVLPHCARRKFDGREPEHHSAYDARSVCKASQQSDGSGLRGFPAAVSKNGYRKKRGRHRRAGFGILFGRHGPES